MKFNRNLFSNISNSFKVNPVVMLIGARQIGKSTLAKDLVAQGLLKQYFTMDDTATLSAASSSPNNFLSTATTSAVIDEVQRVPELFLPLKKLVDENRKISHYLLTGSANVLSLPKISESLAGRVSIHILHALSQGELNKRMEKFIDTIFEQQDLPQIKPIKYNDLMKKIITGGYPEIQHLTANKDRSEWFNSYINTILQRDIRELSNIEGIKELPRLFKILAHRAGGLINFADISRTSDITATTLKRYVTLLETVFFINELKPWHANLGKRLVKSPKLYFNDTGLLANILGFDYTYFIENKDTSGALVENFVILELLKQKAWNKVKCEPYYFRTTAGQEVDLILEATNGKIIGIEIKSRQEAYLKDFDGLKTLQKLTPNKFIRGIVLYTGDKVLAFDKNLFAIPISALWEW